jgi:hypothetical protein
MASVTPILHLTFSSFFLDHLIYPILLSSLCIHQDTYDLPRSFILLPTSGVGIPLENIFILGHFGEIHDRPYFLIFNLKLDS